MAFDPNLLVRNRVFGAKLEATTGVVVTPGSSDCQLFSAVFDPKITPDIKPNVRQGQQYLSKLLTIPGARAGKATFRTEFFSTAGAPAWASLLLPACGLGPGTSSPFSPFTPTPASPINTISIGLFQAGRLKLLAGCAGDFVIRAQAGNPIYFEWTFDGVWQSPSTTAIPGGITYPTTIPPRFAGVTVTVGGQSMRFPNFEFHSGNKLYLRQDQSAVDSASTPVGTGFRGGIVTDREPLIRIAPESYLLSTLDFFAAHTAQTTYNFAFTAGPAGNQLQFSAPKAQLNNPPQDEDREGVMADTLEFIATRTSGDDDYSLTFN
ncbi:MAG TPA: hypothetical protein VK797_22775 [Tepidisphaeraceae bacterium]|jgi:hypothetical protein|nr:hypothetical protein [Tepidisphaeraceae bacterium]